VNVSLEPVHEEGAVVAVDVAAAAARCGAEHRRCPGAREREDVSRRRRRRSLVTGSQTRRWIRTTSSSLHQVVSRTTRPWRASIGRHSVTKASATELAPGRAEPGPSIFSRLRIKVAAPRLPLSALTPFPLVLAPRERLTLHRRLLSSFDHRSSSSRAGFDRSAVADRQATVSAASKLPSGQSTSPSHPPRLRTAVGPEASPRSPPELCRRRQPSRESPSLRHLVRRPSPWASDATPAGMGRPGQIRRWAEPVRGGLGPDGGPLLFILFQFLENVFRFKYSRKFVETSKIHIKSLKCHKNSR
jgi:hypothetical protein